jgi:hypothetical protein
MNGDGLRDILYATDTPNLRIGMIRVFGPKSQCTDLAYQLFVERTKYAKTTMSMSAASPHYMAPAPAVGTSSSAAPQLPGRRYRVTTGSIITNGFEVRVDAFDMRTRRPPPYKRELTPLVRVRRIENFQADDPATWHRLTNWATVNGNLKVIGIDLGEVVPCAATAVTQVQPNRVTNAIITRKSMYDSSEGFLKALNEKKRVPIRIPPSPSSTLNVSMVVPSIMEHEAAMPPRGRSDTVSILNFGAWMRVCEHPMMDFYGSFWIKRKQWDNERGFRGDYERAFCGMLRTAGINTNAPIQPSEHVVVAFGNGYFNTHTGRPTLHTAMTRFFIKKVTLVFRDRKSMLFCTQ